MTLKESLTEIPTVLFSLLQKIASTINGLLDHALGSFAIYGIVMLSLLAGYYMKEAISKNSKSWVWFILISLMIFLSLRYMSIGG